ncbi:MAG: 2'-5' RNA ligase family protein [Patescibacteria group bacterium]
MKIFALYIKIKLTEKPKWFDGFVEKYFEPVDLHITLIQPRYIKEEQISDLQARVEEVLRVFDIREDDKKISFDKLIIDKGSDSKYIFMLNTREGSFIGNFQKELKSALKDWDLFVDNVTKEYEINFKPHITIAVNLDGHMKEEAGKYFIEDYRFEGVLEELVLPLVKDQSLEERKNIDNQKIFKL